MKYSNNAVLAGLGKEERQSLSALLRENKNTITPTQAAQIWNINSVQAAKRLARYCKKGWLNRIHMGVYIPVPLESDTSDVVPEEPFVIATNLYTPCYIGGCNAANYWDLTEQIFSTVTVMTEKTVADHFPEIGGTQYNIHTLRPRYFFGLKSVWLLNVKVKISDPTRTLVDMLVFPDFCGGSRFTVDVLSKYFTSDKKNIDQFIEYLGKVNNGAALKRLGFFLELFFPEEQRLMSYCADNLTTGYAKLSSTQVCDKLITHWRVWVPVSWKEKFDAK